MVSINLLHDISESHVKIDVEMFEDWSDSGPFHLLVGSTFPLGFCIPGIWFPLDGFGLHSTVLLGGKFVSHVYRELYTRYQTLNMSISLDQTLTSVASCRCSTVPVAAACTSWSYR